MAPIPNCHAPPEAGFPGIQDEKRRNQSFQEANLPHPASTPNQRKKMTTSRRLIVAVFVGILVSFTLALGPRIANCLHHRDARGDHPGATRDELHKLLHDHLPEKFQHGVYPTDEEAVEALHEHHAELATSIFRLAKRQDDNVTSTPSDTSDDPDPTDDRTTTADPPVTTPDPPDTTPPTTPPPPSTPQPPTSTPDDDDDPEPTTSSSSSRSRSSTVQTRTSTLPGGDITIVTSTSYYDIPPEETGGGGDPDLQGAAPGQASSGALPALVVAVAGGLMIL